MINNLQPVWVSTDLHVWAPGGIEEAPRDLRIDDRCYRRLDPEYFAWLRSRMFAVKRAVDLGRVSATAFDELRNNFNQVQSLAIRMYGEQTLLAAARSTDPATYRPPLPVDFETRKPSDPVPLKQSSEARRLTRARRLVDAIREQALTLGWTMDGLYNCDGFDRYPISPKYGLVCYIPEDHRIGEVTRQSIELIGPPPRETRMRFYNRNVEQPWIIRVGGEKK